MRSHGCLVSCPLSARGKAFIVTALLLAGSIALPGQLHAAAGDLDPTFGTGGKVTTDFGGTDSARALALQPDGKIVVAGFTEFSGQDFALARYNPDGTLDLGFGSGGKVTTDFGPGDVAGQGLALQPDGKIVVAGRTGAAFALARYQPNGTLDASFGTGGKVTSPAGAGWAVALQADGKIVVAGGAGGGFALARYNPDGTLDASFGSGGTVTTSFGFASQQSFGVAIQADGKIVAVGQALAPCCVAMALARYNPDGTLDAGFGSGGKVLIGGNVHSGAAVALQPDGKIVVAGQGLGTVGVDFLLVRLSPNGALDASFGSGGLVFTDLGTPTSLESARGVAIQSDGKIIVAGTQGNRFALVRYNSNGTLDSSFGSGGKVLTSFGFSTDGAFAVVIQPNGKIVVAGAAGTPTGADFGLARYEGALAPVANAGPDQPGVNEGAPVTLDGSASSGAGLSFAWTQLPGGPVVTTLTGADTANPTFTAPLLPGGFGSQTLTFQLTVTSAAGSSTDTVDVTVVNVNHPPVAQATGPSPVNEGSAVTLSGTTSFDPDGDPLVSHSWIQTGGPALPAGALTGADTATASFTAPLLAGGVSGGVALTFDLTVSDGALSHTDTVTVNVEQVNHAPTAHAGADQTVFAGTVVALNGTGSQDPDGDFLQFQWAQVGGGPGVTLSGASTATPSFTAPPVVAPTPLTFRLTVNDTVLYSEPAEVVITVLRPNDPPQCALAQASPGQLWPPNHKMIPVAIAGVTDPDNDTVSIAITGVTQDERVLGTDPGDTSPDAVLQASTALIRAERADVGNGRVYRLSFTATDGQGASCTGSVAVAVPKNMKPGGGAVDDGQLYDSTLP
ncbi:MAG: hypothetical protein HY002_13540 [Candidatus Rokubacteria bacterium]|nr:hypothetical protein [Candidatus Rokubacteria bacterium]